MSTTVPEWACTWHTGPDAGATHPLPMGRHLVGRAHGAGVRCDDLALQPHHALIDVRPDGEVWLTQLTGRVPVRLAGNPIEGTARVGDDARVEIGGSVLVIHHRSPVVAPAAVHEGALVRGPRAVPRWTPADLVPPTPPAATTEVAGGLVPAILGLGGAALVAVILRQPMFLVFGALGAVVALGSWGTQRLAGRRRRARERTAAAAEQVAFSTALTADRVAFLAWHAAAVPTVAGAHHTLTGRTAALWTRRTAHSDAHLASIGLGDQPWRPAPASRPHAHPEPLVVPDLPVPVSLGDGHRVALHGPLARAVARALIAQLVADCGPADLRIVVVTDRPDAWDCVRALPHAQRPDGGTTVVGEDGLHDALEQFDQDTRGHLLLITDSATALATRTSPLRRAAGGERTALLAVLPDDAVVPHLCSAVLSTGHGPIGRWVADTGTTLLPVPVRLAGMGEAAMFRCSAALAGLHDPEDPLAATGRLPRSVTYTELLAAAGWSLDPEAIAERWAASPDPAPRAAVGLAADGIVDIDLERDGPHGLIAGTTGAGKSELLRCLIVGLAAHADPEQLTFVLVDYKGGATFDTCQRLPHVVGMVTDLDDRLADRALRSLHAELRRREALLREHHAGDLAALRATAPEVPLARLVVVIDEFAALVAEQPDFLHALVGVAQRGRSLGVHLLLATQRPHGVISDDIRANTNLRIALRLHDVADAIDVVGDRSPAQLPRGVPGRAVMRLGADEHVTFQTARCEASDVQAIVDAAARRARPTPVGPWLPDLPATLPRGDIPAGSIGRCDDPDHQRHTPLHWSPTDGSVVVAGSAGSGVSSTLHTLACQALATPDAQVYVLLARAHDRLAALATHPRVVVVEAQERERVMRLVHRLHARLRGSGGTSRVVLLVDGLDVVRRMLDHLDTQAELDALDDVLAHGDAAGITVVCGVEHAAAIPTAVVSRCSRRWVLHLHDPVDAGALGVAAREVPPAVPGRVFLGESGLTAQLVEPGGTPLFRVLEHGGGPSGRIDATPSVVHSSVLPAARRDEATTFLPLGIGMADGEPVELALPDGDHLMVLGGSRTGRSTTLATVTEAWRRAHPTGHVIAVLPRRSLFPERLADEVVERVEALALPSHCDVLLVVDDAELVDDPGGVLAATASGRPGRTIVAAGRPDALRQSYGHWTTVLRRSRTGLVAAGGSDSDGDLLNAVLPRRMPVPARPGLAWLVVQGTVTLVQVAVPGSPAAPRASRTACPHVAK